MFFPLCRLLLKLKRYHAQTRLWINILPEFVNNIFVFIRTESLYSGFFVFKHCINYYILKSAGVLSPLLFSLFR
jgi:hypothetical protein